MLLKDKTEMKEFDLDSDGTIGFKGVFNIN